MNKKYFMCSQEILNKYKRQTPAWLWNHQAGDRFPRNKFFSSRVVYYPAAGADFHALEIFGGAGAAHCFVMADYWTTVEEAKNLLSNYMPRGLSLVSIDPIPLEDVFKSRWIRHFDQDLIEEEKRQNFLQSINAHGFAFFAVYCDGAQRLAVLYLGFEAVEAYDRLFCQGRSPKPPYGILVQNHGMGGDWNQMADPDSYVAQLAEKFGCPKWLIGQDGFPNWNGYQPVSDITYGGMHSTARRLFCIQILLKFPTRFY